jgi:hypothetical protein
MCFIESAMSQEAPVEEKTQSALVAPMSQGTPKRSTTRPSWAPQGPLLKRIDHDAAGRQRSEPRLENRGLRRAQEAEHDALQSRRRIVVARVGTEELDGASQHPVCDRVAGSVGAAEVGEGMQLELTAEDVAVEAQRFARCAGEVEVGYEPVHRLNLDSPGLGRAV